MTLLVTGAAGFIGFHLTHRLLTMGETVVGIDNLNDYYDPELKKARLSALRKLSNETGKNFSFILGDIADMALLKKIFIKNKPKKVVNLAAQAGVRYSIENPSAYIQSNLVGFANILECCRNFNIKHLVYASSSSVYGGNKSLPFKESQGVEHPVSLYAASKRSNELMAHTYSHLYSLPSTGLRFFTVYGPWGRPDMALFLFTKSILKGESIKVFNNGNMIRDFTYIDDIVESLIRVINKDACKDDTFDPFLPNPSTSWAPYRIFNIGNSTPTPLMEYIEAIEDSLGIKAKKTFLPMQAGDVSETSADCNALEKWINFKPYTPVKIGISKFITWYSNFYKKN
mgnify:CR=1 FL=1